MENEKRTLKTGIHEITETMLADYGHGRAIDRLETFLQPDRDVIEQLIWKLLRLMYPGYYRERVYHFYHTESNMTALIEDVAFELCGQIAIALRNCAPVDEVQRRDFDGEAEYLTLQFFDRLPAVRALLDTDLDATLDGDPAAHNKDEIIIAYPGFFAITVNRLAHVLFQLNVPLIPRIMTEYAHSRTGIDIHPGATLGSYFFIDHGTGIVVGETTLIGDHVKVYQGVTLGALSTRGGQKLRGKRRHPTIEDNVTIYAGASILGGDTVIGRDSVIGSNVFITSSIAPGTRVSVKNQELLFKGRSEAVKSDGEKSPINMI